MSRFGVGQEWEPKFPDIAVTDRGRPDAAQAEGDLDDQTAAGLEWIDAPGDSHLHSFSLEDFRQVRRISRLASIAAQGESRVRVRFKPPKNNPGKGVSEYEYLFTDHDEAVRYFGKMIGHPDPGKIVWEMIRAGVSYRAVRR